MENVNSVALGMFNNLIEQAFGQKDKVHGDGFTVVDTVPGAGFSCKMYGEKVLNNGRKIFKTIIMPGPLDASAGKPAEIEEYYSAWVCTEYYDGFEYDAPQRLALPDGAYAWSGQDCDTVTQWYARFKDHLDAETYASSLGENLH